MGSLAELRRALDDDGFVVVRDAVPAERIAACLRVLNLAIRENGLTPEEIGACQQTTFFPHLRWEPEVWGVLPDDAAEIFGWQEGDDWADPQLLLRFPDREKPWPLEAHVDEPPASGTQYKGIVGIAVTPSAAIDGAPRVWRGSHRGSSTSTEPEAIDLAAGDALLMHPQLAHSGALNLGPTVRYAVYFRLLQGPLASAG